MSEFVGGLVQHRALVLLELVMRVMVGRVGGRVGLLLGLAAVRVVALALLLGRAAWLVVVGADALGAPRSSCAASAS